MRDAVKKVVGIFSWIALIVLSFYVLAGEVYSVPTYAAMIALFLFLTSVDIAIRPISAKRDEFRPSISIALFLLTPFVLVLPYYENRFFISQYLPQFDFAWMSYAGIGCLLVGATVTLCGRIQLGKFGGPKIVVEEEHRLITKGIYSHIRHPMYLGYLLLFLGFSLGFRSYILTLLITMGMFVVFRERMNLEERLLEREFGQEYRSYLRRTKRLVPFLY